LEVQNTGQTLLPRLTANNWDADAFSYSLLCSATSDICWCQYWI